jgi:Spy/CpxP family protein refolding chaperone
MKALRLFLLVAVLSAVAAIPAWAQSRNPGQPQDDELWSDPAPGGGGPAAARREEVRNKIAAIRIWRLTDELKLDASTSAKTASILSAVDQQQRDLRRSQMEQLRQLRVLLKSRNPDDTKLKAAIDKLEQDHLAVQESRMKEFTSLRDILTVEQQARYILFQLKFMREMQGMISNARATERGAGRAGRGRAEPAPSGSEPAADR